MRIVNETETDELYNLGMKALLAKVREVVGKKIVKRHKKVLRPFTRQYVLDVVSDRVREETRTHASTGAFTHSITHGQMLVSVLP